MKKLILTAILLLGISSPAFAGVEGVAGAKFDAPNLVRFNQNWTLGIEAGKDLYNIRANDGSFWTEDDKGFSGVAKITYTGTFLNFAKK